MVVFKGKGVSMSKPVHCIVECLTCGKRWETQNSLGVGKRHAVKYKHEVIWEICYAGKYDFRERK